MKIYVIGNLEITDMDQFMIYSKRVREIVRDYGARFLVRGGKNYSIEGDWETHRLVVIEFPDRATHEAMFNSEAYQSIIPYRQAGSRGSLVVVDGVADDA